jgi:hypothetical protein
MQLHSLEEIEGKGFYDGYLEGYRNWKPGDTPPP